MFGVLFCLFLFGVLVCTHWLTRLDEVQVEEFNGEGFEGCDQQAFEGRKCPWSFSYVLCEYNFTLFNHLHALGFINLMGILF